MKKLLLGVLIGSLFSFATVVGASNITEAVIYQAKIFLNGQQKDLGDEYQILNFNGHAYVPIRFVAEEMNGKVTFDEDENSINVTFSSIETVPLTGYTSENAIRNGDIVVTARNEIINGEEIKPFYENYKQKKKDWIRGAVYSLEGDPIIHELLYDGKALWYLYDNVRDEWGSQSRYIAQCKSLDYNETDGEYHLTGCGNLPDLSIPSFKTIKN